MKEKKKKKKKKSADESMMETTADESVLEQGDDVVSALNIDPFWASNLCNLNTYC